MRKGGESNAANIWFVRICYGTCDFLAYDYLRGAIC